MRAKWLPYVGIVVVVGGWLIHYGAERQQHRDMDATVDRVVEQIRVLNRATEAEHPQWWQAIYEAEK